MRHIIAANRKGDTVVLDIDDITSFEYVKNRLTVNMRTSNLQHNFIDERAEPTFLELKKIFSESAIVVQLPALETLDSAALVDAGVDFLNTRRQPQLNVR